MRYAVISDVHANMEALTAVTDSIAAAGVETVVCLGDTVGYGPEPQAAVAAVRQLAAVSVLGNHDRAVFTEGAEARFNEWAEDAICWTREELDAEEIDFLSALPLSLVHEGAFMAHASPRDPASWAYVMDERDAAAQFGGFHETLCLIGHSHEPGFFEWDGTKAAELFGDVLVMESDKRYIVNAGSVGQPRDGDPRAAYAVVDDDELRGDIIRVEYDTERTGRKIVQAGLPAFLAERLTHGT